MTCPSHDDWMLASMALHDEQKTAEFRGHLESCESCRRQFQHARRGHVELLRTYEALDRDHDARREQLMASLPDEAPQPASTGWRARRWRRLGDFIMSMNSPTGRRVAVILAPAACIVIATIAFLMPGQKSALAAAIEHLRSARTIVCRIDMPEGVQLRGMEIKAEGKMYLSSEHGSYVEMYANGMLVQQQYTPPDGLSLMVSPPAQMYFKLDLSDFAMTEDETVARTPAALVQKLRELEAKADEELGSDVIGGLQVVGFRIDGSRLGFSSPSGESDSGASMEIWIDEASALPVEMRIRVPLPGEDGPMNVVLNGFEWDTPLDPGIFEPNIPENFVELDVKFTRPSEETLLHALNKIRELTGGRYTTTLQSVSTISELPGILSDESKEKLAGIGQQGMIQMALEIASGCQYYMRLVQQGREPEYFGDTVSADDADEVLLRWRLDDGQVRVIYGDLRVETLPETKSNE